MKNLLVLLILCLITLQGIGQTDQPEKIVVNVTDLTPDQVAKVKAQNELDQTSQKMQTLGKWAGYGKEVGVAIKEGLNAVVDVADKFGSTDVGKFTMYMIAWKIMGREAVAILLGSFILIIVTIVIFISFRRMYPRKILMKGNRLLFWQDKEYKIIEPRTFEGMELVKILHIFILIGAYGIIFAIMFS